MKKQEERLGILVASFGTSHLDTLEKTIAAVEAETENAYEEAEVYRAFTSGMIRRKLKEEYGILTDDVRDALAHMKKDGIGKVWILPTHVIPGEEYEKVLNEAALMKDEFSEMRIARPLLGYSEDYKECVNAVMNHICLAEDEILLLMGHGTGHFANSAYPALEYTFHSMGYRQVFVGTVEGFPAFEDAFARISDCRKKQILLMPFMVVAGDHAKNDMAGEEDSWLTMLKERGYEVKAVLRGLGEMEEIRELFLQHLKEAELIECRNM